ncbi:hypothetical protein AB6A40_003125 [Gnathostoma spinigerum]|uniref:Secreted protein n=1 Tax=Gnathostoma spinigerum TaxID=75299 RepID=A0ABD6E9W9_9BILA
MWRRSWFLVLRVHNTGCGQGRLVGGAYGCLVLHQSTCFAHVHLSALSPKCFLCSMFLAATNVFSAQYCHGAAFFSDADHEFHCIRTCNEMCDSRRTQKTLSCKRRMFPIEYLQRNSVMWVHRKLVVRLRRSNLTYNFEFGGRGLRAHGTGEKRSAGHIVKDIVKEQRAG